MKIRLKENSIRFRLSMSEVESLCGEGVIESITQFPNGEQLTYSLQITKIDEINPSLENNTLRLHLPEKMLRDWHESERIGFEWNSMLDQGGVLKVLLEKDFKCLTNRPYEDESNLYPNPNQSHM